MVASSQVVGAGLIASLFKPISFSDDTLVFASGVSNSLEKEEYNFQREIELLLKNAQSFPSHRVIYFSSIPILRADTQRYFDHKKRIEQIICEKFNRYLILRLPSVAGHSNKNTLLNFIARALIENQELKINSSARRRFINTDDLTRVACKIIEASDESCVLDLCSDTSIPVLDIVHTIASALNKKTEKINLYSSHESIIMDNSRAKRLLGKDDRIFKPEYNLQCLELFLAGLIGETK